MEAVDGETRLWKARGGRRGRGDAVWGGRVRSRAGEGWVIGKKAKEGGKRPWGE